MGKWLFKIMMAVLLVPTLVIMAAHTGHVSAAPLPSGAADGCPAGWTYWGGYCHPPSLVDCADDQIGNRSGGAQADTASNCKSMTWIVGTPNCGQWVFDGISVHCAVPGGTYPGGNISAAVGCVNILRQPFPRALVNVPVKFGLASLASGGRYSLLVDPASFRAGQAGYSTAPAIPVGTGERLGASAGAPGVPANSTRIWGGAGSIQKFVPVAVSAHSGQVGNGYYPNIQAVYSWLELFPALDFGSAPVAWTAGTQDINGYRGASYENPINPRPNHFGAPDGFLQFTYFLSSWGRPGHGPAQDLSLTLPAYQVKIAIPWRAYQVAFYQAWHITGHQYKPVNAQFFSTVSASASNDPYQSFRIRDPRVPAWQSTDCAANGYIGVPVIEAQTVLVK